MKKHPTLILVWQSFCHCTDQEGVCAPPFTLPHISPEPKPPTTKIHHCSKSPAKILDSNNLEIQQCPSCQLQKFFIIISECCKNTTTNPGWRAMEVFSIFCYPSVLCSTKIGFSCTLYWIVKRESVLLCYADDSRDRSYVKESN